MTNHAIIRVDKCKMGAVGRIGKHHEREKQEYKSNPDIDTAKSHLNYHLREPTAGYRQMVLERIKETGVKQRKDSVVMQDGLITASPDWIKSRPVDEQKEFFNYAYEFVRDRYGEKNILSAVVHLDEATPHMHFVFTPITEDNRLSSKTIMGGPKGMTKLQDDFYKYISERYQGEFSRGIPSRVTHRTHLPTYLYKNAKDLYSHYEEIRNAINDIGLIGNAKKKDEAIALLGRYAPEMAKMEEQLKTTDKKVKELEGELRNSHSLISQYRAQNREQDEEIGKLEEEIYDLRMMQEELQKQISRIPPDLLQEMKERERARRKAERDWGAR